MVGNPSGGFHLLKRPKAFGTATHYAILDAANQLGDSRFGWGKPVLYEQKPPGLQVSEFVDDGSWTLVGRYVDQATTAERIFEAAKDPEYRLFGNNCEDFVNFVLTGRRGSPQAEALKVAVGIGGFFIVVGALAVALDA